MRFSIANRRLWALGTAAILSLCISQLSNGYDYDSNDTNDTDTNQPDDDSLPHGTTNPNGTMTFPAISCFNTFQTRKLTISEIEWGWDHSRGYGDDIRPLNTTYSHMEESDTKYISVWVNGDPQYDSALDRYRFVGTPTVNGRWDGWFDKKPVALHAGSYWIRKNTQLTEFTQLHEDPDNRNGWKEVYLLIVGFHELDLDDDEDVDTFSWSVSAGGVSLSGSSLKLKIPTPAISLSLGVDWKDIAALYQENDLLLNKPADVVLGIALAADGQKAIAGWYRKSGVERKFYSPDDIWHLHPKKYNTYYRNQYRILYPYMFHGR